MRRTSIHLPPECRQHLEERGAVRHKGKTPDSLTVHMRRVFQLYEWMTSASDPRTTQQMSEADYQLVVAGIDPDAIEPSQIRRLGDYLRDRPDFRALAKRAGRDPERLCDELDQYPFAENLHLFDRARIAVSQR